MRIPISKRLLCCAELVPPGARVADVGCDHGYLGIYLLQQGIARTVAAMDLRREPLETARRNARRFGVEGQMTFSVCDGLSGTAADQLDAVVCAGMGGGTSAAILERCPWAADEEITWILQPQSSGNDLRRYLGRRGYAIQQERLVLDGGFLYTVMLVRSGGGQPLSPGAQYVTPQLLKNDPALVRAYLDRVLAGLRRAVDGLTAARAESSLRLAYYETALQEVLEMEETYAAGTGN